MARRLGIDTGVLCAATADRLGEGGGGIAAESVLGIATDDCTNGPTGVIDCDEGVA